MIFDYFFFKFYKGILKSSVPEFPRFGASLFFGLHISLNILMLSAILAKLDILQCIYNKTIAYMSTPVIAAVIFLVYNNTRIEVIKLKFAEDAFQPKKKKLNIIFVLYVVFTSLSIYLVAFWKPGYLPSFFKI
jgi:hypothetical protein